MIDMSTISLSYLQMVFLLVLILNVCAVLKVTFDLITTDFIHDWFQERKFKAIFMFLLIYTCHWLFILFAFKNRL